MVDLSFVVSGYLDSNFHSFREVLENIYVDIVYACMMQSNKYQFSHY